MYAAPVYEPPLMVRVELEPSIVTTAAPLVLVVVAVQLVNVMLEPPFALNAVPATFAVQFSIISVELFFPPTVEAPVLWLSIVQSNNVNLPPSVQSPVLAVLIVPFLILSSPLTVISTGTLPLTDVLDVVKVLPFKSIDTDLPDSIVKNPPVVKAKSMSEAKVTVPPSAIALRKSHSAADITTKPVVVSGIVAPSSLII